MCHVPGLLYFGNAFYYVGNSVGSPNNVFNSHATSQAPAVLVRSHLAVRAHSGGHFRGQAKPSLKMRNKEKARAEKVEQEKTQAVDEIAQKRAARAA